MKMKMSKGTHLNLLFLQPAAISRPADGCCGRHVLPQQAAAHRLAAARLGNTAPAASASICQMPCGTCQHRKRCAKGGSTRGVAMRRPLCRVLRNRWARHAAPPARPCLWPCCVCMSAKSHRSQHAGPEEMGGWANEVGHLEESGHDLRGRRRQQIRCLPVCLQQQQVMQA